MALNLDFTLKRNNGTDYDTLLPTTVIEQIHRKGDSVSLVDILAAKIETNQKGAANGVAPLNSSSKIADAYLPDYVFGGMKYKGTVSLGTTMTLTDLFSSTVNESTKDTAIGAYFIVSVAGTLTGQTPPGTAGSYIYVWGFQDDGQTTTDNTLEVGDWIVYRKVEATSNYFTFWFDVVNNTQKDATEAAKGIVQLSNATVTTSMDGSSKVITEDVLFDLIGTAAGKIAAGNHTHAYQPIDSDLTAIAGLTPGNKSVIIGNGSAWVAESGATLRTSLGLAIGTDVQAQNAALQSIAGLTTAADRMIYTTAANTYAVTTLSSFIRTLLDDADAAAARTTLGLVIGTDVQAQNSTLSQISALANTAGNVIIGNGTQFVVQSGDTLRSSLGLAIGTNVQAYSAGLAAIAGLALTNQNFIMANGSSWEAQTPTQVRATLSVYSQTEVNTLLTNRPKFFYDTTAGSATGDYIIDLD